MRPPRPCGHQAPGRRLGAEEGSREVDLERAAPGVRFVVERAGAVVGARAGDEAPETTELGGELFDDLAGPVGQVEPGDHGPRPRGAHRASGRFGARRVGVPRDADVVPGAGERDRRGAADAGVRARDDHRSAHAAMAAR